MGKRTAFVYLLMVPCIDGELIIDRLFNPDVDTGTDSPN